MPYERDNIARLAAYVPGEQPQTGRVIKLNTNENPYPPIDAVLQAIHGVTPEQLRRYPSPAADRFREAAARVHGVTPEQVIATNGGDELLRLVVSVFCEPTGPEGTGGIATADPSYSLYPVLAQIQNTPVTRIPLNEDFSIPDDFADRANEAGCRLAFIVNPHAPSGRLQPLDQLEQIARKFKGVLLIDEAYVDFATHDALPLLDAAKGLDNVMVLRSLSKGYSLAGIRFGYGMGHPQIIAALHKARDSYNTDVLSQAAAVASLEHREQIKVGWQNVIAQRQRLTQQLQDADWFVYPSQSNFVLAVPPETGPNAQQLYESLKKQGIFVRYFDQDRLRDKLRITIGTPEQNNVLLDALNKPLAV